MSIIHEVPYQKAIPCCPIEHLITLQEISFFAIGKENR